MDMDPATRKLSRRAALRLFGAAAGVALLAACQAPASTTGPTLAAAPAAKPTSPAGAPPTSAAASGAAGAATPAGATTPGSAATAGAATTSAATPATAATGANAATGAVDDAAARAGFLHAGVGATSTAPVTAPKGQPHSGGTLRQGYLGDLPNLDGHWISGQHTIYPIWDRLVDLDASLQPHPALAESWEVNADFSQATFHLRKGVTWHTGRDLTSEDIAWNYNRIK